MAWMQLAGMGLSMLSSYGKGKQASDDMDAMNAAKLQQFDDNKAMVAEMLGTLDERTNRAESEAVGAAIRTKLNVRKAQKVAEGQATVRAAQMGGGSGKRASLATFRPAARVAGDMISDANINLQTELTNITEHFNDTATKAIANLNNNRPILGDASMNTGQMLLNAAGTAINKWNQLSQPSKEEIKGIFKTTPADNTLLDNQSISSGTEYAFFA